MKPTIGRIVHFVQAKPKGFAPGLVHLPAIITAVWGGEYVNLQVFTDGTNSDDQHVASMKWVTSAILDETAQTERSWHWPERD